MGWMGPVVDGPEHEGWVVPLFADGAQGAGASSARGVLVWPADQTTARGTATGYG
jgi:hypothetical protein